MTGMIRLNAIETTVFKQAGDRRAVTAKRSIVVGIAGRKPARHHAKLGVNAVHAIGQPRESLSIGAAGNAGLNIRLIDR